MTEKQKISLLYHRIFDYELSREELNRWVAGSALTLPKESTTKVLLKKNSGKRYIQENEKKLLIATSASKILFGFPTVLFVGVTGSLAMNNATPESDIDLMVITRRNTLWLTRLIIFLRLKSLGFSLRRANNKDEKNKLCFNLWIDEGALTFPGMPRNVYTAHEIAQVVPLVNKNNIYEKWISENLWVKSYWPNAVNVKNKKRKGSTKNVSASFVVDLFLSIINLSLFIVEYLYMKKKITRERVSTNFAFFHPFDWGNIILKKLQKKGVIETA